MSNPEETSKIYLNKIFKEINCTITGEFQIALNVLFYFVYDKNSRDQLGKIIR